MQKMHIYHKYLSITLGFFAAVGLLMTMVSLTAIPTESASPSLNFSQGQYYTGENDGNGTITVTLDAPVPYTVTVDFETSDHTAVADIDYTQTAGTLIFTPGMTLARFWVNVIDNDEDVHPNLQAHLAITNPMGALLGPAKTAYLTIIDDEFSQAFLPFKINYPPPPQPIPTDLLLNNGFENGFTHDTFDGSWLYYLLTPKDWISWWEDEPSSVQYPMHAPEVRPILNDGIYAYPIPRIRSGDYAIQMFRAWGRYRAGFYQQVQNLIPGTQAHFSYYAHAWSCNDDPPPALSCGDPYAFYFKAGIDPAGGTDPWSENIIWSDPFYIYDVYDKVGPVQATVGLEGQVTVYILAHARYAVKFNDAYFDDAKLALQQP